MISKDRLNGLILIGGTSSRMGQEKFMIDYHGQPQYRHLHELLQPYCQKVYISCNQEQQSKIDLPKVIDQKNDSGPLEGIRSAFKKESCSWLIVACDMPDAGPLHIEKLIAATGPESDVICAIDSDQINPLLAIYNESCGTKLNHFKGDSPRIFIKSTNYKGIPLITSNLNTREEAERYRSRMR